MSSVGPVFPDTFAFAWILALAVPVLVAAVGLLLLYLVIRKAVAAGIRDARKQDPRPPSGPER